jgi:hypothetical protein
MQTTQGLPICPHNQHTPDPLLPINPGKATARTHMQKSRWSVFMVCVRRHVLPRDKPDNEKGEFNEC